MDTKTEHRRAIATDLDDLRKQWYREGVLAGAAHERARVKAVEDQAMPGHEALLQTLMFDGKTTGEEAAVLILAAEKRKLGLGAYTTAEFHTDAPRTAVSGPIETMAPSRPEAQVEAVAKHEWANDPKLAREFSSEAQYVAFRKAEASGCVRILNKPKVR